MLTTGTTIRAEDGRVLTITTAHAGPSAWYELSDGHTDYIAMHSATRADQYVFSPASLHSRRPGGLFTVPTPAP